jgi:hypothetical protein
MALNSPTNVSGITGIQHILLTWTAPSGSPDSYTILRQLGVGGATVTIGTSGATTFQDYDVIKGATYKYSVIANKVGSTSSAPSAVVTVMYGGAANPYVPAEGGFKATGGALSVYNGVVKTGGGESVRLQRLRGLTTTYLS